MKRSKFSLSNYKLFSCDMGELVPCGVLEVLPGDTIQHSTSGLIRCAPLLAPVMHPVHVRFHHWYVPYRLIWDNFENFITGGPDGMNASVFPTKILTTAQTAAGGLSDYLGFPSHNSNYVSSALPFRAYALIWNEWYRDQDLETALTVATGDGNDTTTPVALQNCAWEKDYFTAARPWEQKGPAITIPLGTTAPVLGIGKGTQAYPVAGQTVFQSPGGASTSYPFSARIDPTPLDGQLFVQGSAAAGGNLNIRADLSSASSITVAALREALSLQRFEEARARYGSRYVEYLRYLGVRSSDARLSRPEYLGGGRQTIQFSEVLQTAPGTDPVGEMKGHGISAMRSNRYRRFIEEHGVIITLMSTRPKTMYYQGIPRQYNRRFKEDFWQKELEHIGQQEVLNKELYIASGTPDGVFGFTNRYQEYREQNSSVGGEFKSASLNFWHMARDFGSAPALNASFVKAVPTERSFAVPSEDVLYVMCKHSIQARRLVSASAGSYIY